MVHLLHDLAVTRQIPVACSIHQPRSSIWQRIDGVILLAPGGRVCYAGPRADAVAYMEALGYPLPVHTNPADFLVDLVSVDAENVVQAAEDERRIHGLATAFREYQRTRGEARLQNEQRRKKDENDDLVVSVVDVPAWDSSYLWKRRSWKSLVRWIPRLSALVQRTWRQNIRDTTINVARAVLSIANAGLMAGMFPTVRGALPMVNSVTDRVALLSFAAIQMCMLSYMKAVTLFAKERRVVTREDYSVIEYIMSKLLAEIPLDSVFAVLFATTLKKCTGLQIGWGPLSMVFTMTSIAGATMGYSLGSVSPNNEVYATVAGIPILVVFMIVGVINPSGRDESFAPPRVVQYIKEASPIVSILDSDQSTTLAARLTSRCSASLTQAYAIEALCLGEYTGVQFTSGSSLWKRIRQTPKMGGLSLVQNGDQVLKALGLHGQSFNAALKRLAQM